MQNLRCEHTIWTVGENASGQLGLGDISGRRVVTEFTAVHLPQRVQRVLAGGNFMLVITEGGDLYACGENGWGQLGLGHYLDTPNLEHVELPYRVVDVAVGFRFSILLLSNGDIYAAGSQRIISHQPQNSCIFLRLIPHSLIPRKTHLYASSETAFILTDEGFLYAWGSNESGQAGVPHPRSRQAVFFHPTRVTGSAAGPFLVERLWAGSTSHHVVAQTRDGKMFAWGNNRNSVILYESPENFTLQCPHEVQWMQGDHDLMHSERGHPQPACIRQRMKNLAVGNEETVLVTEDNRIWFLGQNGILKTNRPLPLYLPHPISITDVAAGGDTDPFNDQLYHCHSCFIVDGNEVWTFGSNNCGQLGTGNVIPSIVPVKISLGGRVNRCATGSWFSVVYFIRETSFISDVHSLWCNM